MKFPLTIAFFLTLAAVLPLQAQDARDSHGRSGGTLLDFGPDGSKGTTRNAWTTASASAQVMPGISLTKSRDLSFGTIANVNDGGTVVIDPNTGMATFNNVTKGHGDALRTAQFITSGDASHLFTISFPSEVTLSHQQGSGNGIGNGKNRIVVKNFVCSDGAGQLDEQGVQTFSVGATLQFGPSPATGSYSGAFDVTVQYQ